ncbi:MAG: hypothetical protein RLZZ603_31 [Actinomycetota bacterium]
MNPGKTESRLRVGVIGAGPVGIILAQALAGAGHLISGIHATSPQSLENIDAMLPQVSVLEIQDLLAASDLVLLAIPEDQIQSSVEGWAKLGLFTPGQLLIHTAAEHGIGVLSAAAAAGVIPLAIHPAMRFTGTSLDLARIRESFFAVTAPAVAVPIGQALVIEMGAEPVVITDADRPKYAEAVAVASGFSALIVNQAIGLLNEIEVVSARELLGPLVRSSVEVALAEGFQDIQPEDLEG